MSLAPHAADHIVCRRSIAENSGVLAAWMDDRQSMLSRRRMVSHLQKQPDLQNTSNVAFPPGWQLRLPFERFEGKKTPHQQGWSLLGAFDTAAAPAASGPGTAGASPAPGPAGSAGGHGRRARPTAGGWPWRCGAGRRHGTPATGKQAPTMDGGPHGQKD